MEKKGRRERNETKRTLTFLIAFISCFCTSDFKHLSMTVWCNSVLALRCFVHIPKSNSNPSVSFFFPPFTDVSSIRFGIRLLSQIVTFVGRSLDMRQN